MCKVCSGSQSQSLSLCVALLLVLLTSVTLILIPMNPMMTLLLLFLHDHGFPLFFLHRFEPFIQSQEEGSNRLTRAIDQLIQQALGEKIIVWCKR